MGKQHYRIIPIYKELVEKKNGELPTAREVSGFAGAPVKYVRDTLNKANLPYRRIVDSRAALQARMRRREEQDKLFREKHESLTRSAGRYPTRIEMNAAVGYRRESSQAADVAGRLGLELTPQRHRPEWASVSVRTLEEQSASGCGRGPHPSAAPTPSPEGKACTPEYDFGHRAAPNMMRIYEIRTGELLGEGKGWGSIAGEQYAPTDRVMITCPVCGARRIISPRMHPFWLRNRLGKVVFVDSRACTGQIQ